MERLKTASKKVVGVGSYYFMILKNTERNDYTYYIKTWITFFQRQIIIKTTKKRSVFLDLVLNKSTMFLIYIIVNLVMSFIAAPLFYLLLPFYAYFKGLSDLINNVVYGEIKAFTWINFIGFIAMTILYLINNF